MTWLRARPRLSLAVAVLALLVILGVDLVVPGYAIAGAYLVLVIFAAVALPQRTALVIAAVGLALTLGVMAVQDRMDTENLLLVWFGVLAGAGLFALVESLQQRRGALPAAGRPPRPRVLPRRPGGRHAPPGRPEGGRGDRHPPAGRAARGRHG